MEALKLGLVIGGLMLGYFMFVALLIIIRLLLEMI